MKPAIAALCEFDVPVDGKDSLRIADRAWALAHKWQLEASWRETCQTPTGERLLEDGTSVEWETIESGRQMVRRLTHSIQGSDKSEGWRTVVWVCSDGVDVFGVVRSGPLVIPGTVRPVRFAVGTPRIVRDWIAELDVASDGLLLATTAAGIDSSEFAVLEELLPNPKRRLPIVAVSVGHSADGTADVEASWGHANRLASDLVGNAHVFHVTEEASWELTNRYGQRHSVFDGAVRVWWPGFTYDDDPFRHPLILRDRFRVDPDGERRRLTNMIWRAAADAIGPPELESALLFRQEQEAREQVIAKARSEIAKMRSEIGGVASDHTLQNAGANLNPSAHLEQKGQQLPDDFDEWLDDYEEQLVKLEAQAEEIRDLKKLLQKANQEIQILRSEVDELQRGDSAIPATMAEAINRASRNAEGIIIHDKAWASKSEYSDFGHVLEDLNVIAKVAKMWRDGELANRTLQDAFRDIVGGRYRTGVGQGLIQYPEDYALFYKGETVYMGPHLHRGKGPPTTQLCIYWYVDKDERVFVIGHIGKKLRDTTNRN